MPIKRYKPTTAGRRNSSVQTFDDITKHRPEKSLTVPLKKNAGRNNQGKITVRHKGGGVKRYYRLVDFKRKDFDKQAEILAIEYDPNRGPRIALVQYEDGKKSYIICPKGLKIGEKVVSSDKAVEAKMGNRMPLEYIPSGMFIYNVELTPGKGGQLVRGAGNTAQLMNIEEDSAIIKLPSGEIRKVSKKCAGTIGEIGNEDYHLVRWGKAGRKRMMGIKPTVKGKNMNPVDHPHGGGEGHSPIGQKRGPQTIYGKTAMGARTRKPGKWSDKFIVKSRRKSKRRK
ncbi:MAG: 50S ribosomal protein L2 [bacterium]